MSAVGQLTTIRNRMRDILGEHPRAVIRGRTDILHPAITPDAAERTLALIRPSIRSAVGRDEFDVIVGRLAEDERPSEIIEAPGLFRSGGVTWANKVRAVAGVRRAELAYLATRIPITGPLHLETIDGRLVMDAGMTVAYWEGLQDAALFGSALSARVTFGDKIEAFLEGVGEGAADVVVTATGAAAKVAEVGVGSVLRGFINGLGPLGLIAIGVGVYVAVKA